MQTVDIARLTAGYMLVGTLYILFSDHLLFAVFPDLEDIKSVSIAKGLGFVSVTAAFLAGYLVWVRRTADAWRQALMQSPDAIVLLFDPATAVVVDASPAACRFYGWSLEEFRGMRLWDFNELSEARIRELLGGAQAQEGHQYRFRHRVASGEVREVVVQSGPISHHGRTLMLSIIQDITDLQHSAAELQRLQRLHDLLGEAGQLTMRVQDRTQYFHALCNLIVAHTELRFAWIGMVDSRGVAVPVAHAGDDRGYVEHVQATACMTDSHGTGPTGQALRSGRSVVSNDFLRDPATAAWHEMAIAAGVRASAAIPFRGDGEVLGTLNLYAGEVNYFGELERNTLESLAGDISFALDSLKRMESLNMTAAVLASSKVVLARWSAAPGWPVLFITDNVALWGYTAAAFMLGKVTFHQVVHPEDEARVLAELEYYTARKIDRFQQQYRVRTPDGTVRWVQDQTEVVRDDKGEVVHFQSALTDITESLRMQQALRDVDERYRNMVTHSPDTIIVAREGVVRYVNPAGVSLLGASTEQDIVGRQLDALFDPASRDALRERFAPLQAASGRVAPFAQANMVALDGSVLDMEVSASSFLENEHVDMLVICRDMRARREAEVLIRRHLERLERAVEGTTLAISHMVELRDPYTAGHERRVGELSAAIAARIGLDDNTCKGLRVAGAVHDVGKIMVPAEILTKPSRLTPLEMALVKTHAEHGYEVLRNVDYPWPVAEVARQHHERLDGSGYPRGLKGDDILLEARIVAVADVVESMTSDRPYRPGLGLDRALAEIREGRGARYDERVVDECLALFLDGHYAFDGEDHPVRADNVATIQ